MAKRRGSWAVVLGPFAGTRTEAILRYNQSQNHGDRLFAVRMALDFACNELELNRHVHQDQSEDQLTIQICSMLKMAGFEVAHDEQIGGHCDIVIKGLQSFLWLAEAKKHDAYAWLDAGYKQLSTRYSTGVPGQDNGDIIIYCFNADANAMLIKWRDELVARNDGVKAKVTKPLEFYSSHKHNASGLLFHIRHKAVVLHWKPAA